MAMGPDRAQKQDCAGEAQQQFTRQEGKCEMRIKEQKKKKKKRERNNITRTRNRK
jgi:hypothetical protein